MTDQTIVAVYDTAATAKNAVQDLLTAGVPESSIDRHAQEGSYAGTATAPVARTEAGTGFWASLFGGEPDHDVAVYDRSLSSGSSAVSVRVPDAHVPAVMDILERHNPVDLDDRAGSYGLTQTATMGAANVGTAARTDAALAGVAATGTATTRAANDEGGTIQLSEETLAVGKRAVNRGTTRIRRFVVETPVEEQVRLRDERVSIERHAVTDGRAVADADWADKTIEMTESTEEAVISKTARIKEEISLRKEVTERTETIRDTVRREDVEIVKEPVDQMVVSDTPARRSAV